MSAVELTREQAEKKRELEEGLEKAYKMLQSPGSGDHNAEVELIKRLGDIAHDLHINLGARGFEPVHHRVMIENRGMQPDDPAFYMHIHPIEDLLKYINDVHANDDPEDVTLNVEFKLRVYSRRWGHDDTYRFTRTKTGWNVRFLAIGGDCDQSGRPFLFDNLRHDEIPYPSNLHWWLEWLWDQAQSQGLTAEQVQGALDEVSEWLREIEHSAPRGGVWSGFND